MTDKKKKCSTRGISCIPEFGHKYPGMPVSIYRVLDVTDFVHHTHVLSTFVPGSVQTERLFFLAKVYPVHSLNHLCPILSNKHQGISDFVSCLQQYKNRCLAIIVRG